MNKKVCLPRWDRLVEMSHDLLCVTGPTGRLTFLNRAWQHGLQYSPDELVGRSLLDIVHPDDRARAEQAFASLLTEQSVEDLEIRCTAKDGTTCHVSWSMTLVQEEQAVYGVGREITLRNRAGAEPRGEPWLFQAMMEQSALPIELIAPDGRITAVNDAWRRMWGISEEETSGFISRYNMLKDAQADELGIGLLIRKAFAGESVVLPPIEYSPALAGDQVGLSFSTEAKPWIQCLLNPVKNEHDEVLLVVNTYVDLTGLKHAERHACELREALQDVFRAALNRDAADRAFRVEAAASLKKMTTLTPREREVMIHVIAGRPNKAIADDLGITLVTVKVHRGQVMRKLGVSSVVDLVRLCELAGVSPTL